MQFNQSLHGSSDQRMTSCFTKNFGHPKPKADYQKTSGLADYVRLQSFSALDSLYQRATDHKSYPVSGIVYWKAFQSCFFFLTLQQMNYWVPDPTWHWIGVNPTQECPWVSAVNNTEVPSRTKLHKVMTKNGWQSQNLLGKLVW